MLRRLIALAALLAALSPHGAIAQETITVFAAASLKNALDDVDAAFGKTTGAKVTASYEASSALAKQIEAGAPADVFISADLRWMDYVAERKLIKPDTRINLLGNKLVLIAPKDSKLDHVAIAQSFDIAKLAGDGRIAVADVKAVPAGLYAKAALEKLGAWAAAEPKLAQAENVRATLAFVRDRRPDRAEGEDRRHLSRRLLSAGHLPRGCDRKHDQGFGDEISCLPAHEAGQGHLREIRLQRAGDAGVVRANCSMRSPMARVLPLPCGERVGVRG